MSTYISPDGRRSVDPGPMPRGDIRRLRKAARKREPRTPPPPDEQAPEPPQDAA